MNEYHLDFKKRTKIVATLGPASSSKDVIREMIKAGLNAVRLNFSHGDHESHAQVIVTVRELCEELKVPVAIIGDLRGPHLRVGDIESGEVSLETGQTFTLTPDICLGNAERATISFPKLARDLQPNSLLLLDDGSIHMRVTRLTPDNRVEGIITQGGTLASRRGVNVPGINLSLPPLTQKDLTDIDFAIEQDIDFLALSFVQSANDIQTLKTILAAKQCEIAVIAKIEMSGALEDIENVVNEADAIMVARGDMALEMSFREVPIAQKRIIAICRRKAVPVITATQMLESMITANKPTRAEVTDVANAVFDGTDALMLSGETAIGQYPADTIATMSRIAMRAEQAWNNQEIPKPPAIEPGPTVSEIISYSGSMTAQHLKAAAIVGYSRSGRTIRRISRFRSETPILGLTPRKQTYNQLTLSWGVTPVLIEDLKSTDAMTETATNYAASLGVAKSGDYVIIISGNPDGPPGNTNILRIERL